MNSFGPHCRLNKIGSNAFDICNNGFKGSFFLGWFICEGLFLLFTGTEALNCLDQSKREKGTQEEPNHNEDLYLIDACHRLW